MKHRTTDPACRFHVPPTGWFSRRRFDRARGRSCPVCMGPGERAALRLLSIPVRAICTCVDHLPLGGTPLPECPRHNPTDRPNGSDR